MKKNVTRNNRRRGFTLVEILIVLGIMVFLLAMVGPRLLGSKQKADIQAAKTQIGLFEQSLQSYVLDMNTFPETEAGLAALIEKPEGSSEGEGEGKKDKWDGPYLQKTTLPKDPWGNDYQYEFPPSHGKGKDPEIWSYGPDGQDNTEDDIVNWEKEDSENGAADPGTSTASN
ncbi:MAG: type II secretion system major pseudopilin GspG [Planctomycetaceae bacterium]|nr:type II secretion system major pseudopilin GspG [Planctomycetaceae bacterium]